MRILSLALAACLPLSSLAAGKPEPSPSAAPGEKAKTADKEDSEPKLSITEHQITISGQLVKYRATVGYLMEKAETDGAPENKEDKSAPPDADGLKPKGKIFFTAYTRELEAATANTARPLTFAINGGPGAASVWLHLGALGPRRVALTPAGEAPPPPAQLTDNEASWLDRTDLVFIDPISTGYSRPASGTKAEDFHAFQKDIASIAEFIRLYTTRQERWLSPKFLIGESYGTTRAAALADYLQDHTGLYLNGIILLSSVLDFQTIDFSPNNDLPYPLFLPSYATAAWYHKKLSPAWQSQPVDAVRHAAEQFADHDYLVALAQGDALPAAEKQRVAGKLAEFSGLPAALFAQRNLRLDPGSFSTLLLLGENRSLGRYDARYTGIRYHPGTEEGDFDPSFEAISGPITASINDYLRRELKFTTDLQYQTLADVFPWDWSPAKNRYVNTAEALRQAMSRNPYLKVWVCAGLYDFATPYHAAEYAVRQLNLDPAIRSNIQLTTYPAGHMMYTLAESRAQLKSDFADFLTRTLQQKPVSSAARPE